MTKKFSIKKLVAGALAAAMVVTALPVSGLAVKAADTTSTVKVYRSYNPNNSEHLYTVDADEHSACVARGYNNEGEAWTAPVTSNTEVYRVYDPNSGEHLLVPKSEAEGLALQGWSNEGCKMYSDDKKGVPVYRVYNPNSTNAGRHHYTSNYNEAASLVTQGWSWDNKGEAVLYGVKDVKLPDDQIEGAIKIEDVSGLQSDGTALAGDTLRAIVPATLGSFSNVIFYRDGIQLNSTTNAGANMAVVANRPGKYTVSVIGTDNKVYLSNSIDVVGEEAPAVIKSVSIEDDYATPRIILGTEDTEAVISVALNKAYNGFIRVYKAADLKFTNAPVVSESTIINNGGGGAGAVDQVLAMPTTAQVAAATDGNVMVYIDPETGVATYKFTVAATAGEDIVRGTEYKVIFDQNTITTDTAGQGKENVGPNTITAPYLETPKTMSIDSAGNGQPVVISFRNEKGEIMSWMGNPVAQLANVFLSQLKIYSDTDSDMKDGTDLGGDITADKINKGVLTTSAIGDTNAFYYATAKTVSGLFGTKALDLSSSLGKAAQAASDGVTISQNSKDPYSADIEFTNLRTDGTVYVLQSTTAKQAGRTDTSMVASFVGGAISSKANEKVTSGTKKITISGAVDAINTNNIHYLALFVPEDQKNYSMVASTTVNDPDGTPDNGDEYVGLVVASKLTSFALGGSADTITGSKASATTGAPAANEKYIIAKDQFGDVIDFTAAMAVNGGSAGTGVDMVDAEPTVDAGVGATLELAASTGVAASEGKYVGIITLKPDKATTVDNGKSFTIKLATGQTLTAKCKAKGNADASKWTLSF